MVTISCGVAVPKALRYLAALSGVLSLCGIVTWGWSIHNVLILANARQHIRLALLRVIDQELESLFDEYVPGPRGNKGIVALLEPENDLSAVFEGAMLFIGILSILIVTQIIHVFLAIWLYSAAKSKNYEGVNAWFNWTVTLFLVTLAAAIVQMILVTFHGVFLAVIVILLLFYLYALLVAREFQVQIQNQVVKSKERGVIYQRLRNGVRVVLVEVGAVLV